MTPLRLLAGLLALAALPAGAAAAPSDWQEPVALSQPTGVRPPGPALAVGRSGPVVATWVRPLGTGGRQAVEARRRPRPAAGFGATVQLDRFTGPAATPSAGVPRDATATVAWLRDRLPAATRLPLTGPAEPFVALPATGAAEGLSIGVDRAGTAVAAWAQRGDPSAPLSAVVAAERPAGAGAFAAPVTLATASSGPPELAVAPDGRAAAAWIGPEGAVWAASRDPATGWQPAARLSGPGPARGLSVAIAEVGGAIVGWFEDSPMVAIRDRSGAWSAPEAVAPPGALPPRSRPDVAISFLGDTCAVAWRQGPAPLALRVAWRGNPARPWRVSPIAGPSRNVGEPELVMSQSGDALVAWSQPLSSGAGIRARRVPRGGPLGPVETVSTGSGARVEPALAIGTGGAVTAAWVALPSSGSFAGRIRFVAAARRLPLV